MRTRSLVVGAVLSVSALLGAVSPAQAATSPQIPVPSNATAISNGNAAHFVIKNPDGSTTPVTVSFASGRISQAQAVAAGAKLAAVTPAALYCGTASLTVQYGPNSAWLVRFTYSTNWCGNGSVISGTPGSIVSGTVSGWAAATGVSYKGVLERDMNLWYAGWAYQGHVEGLWQTCYPILGCGGNHYPQVWINMYANGTSTGSSSS